MQRGNPILESVRNVGKEFGDILADYQVGRTTGVLFLRYVELCLATIPRSKHTAVLAVYDTIDYTLNIFMSMESCQTQTHIHIDSQLTNNDFNEEVLKFFSNLLSTFGQKIFSQVI